MGHSFDTGYKRKNENYLEALNMSREKLDELVDWTHVGLLASESVL